MRRRLILSDRMSVRWPALLVVAATLPVALVGMLAIWQARERAIAQALANGQELARRAASEIGRTVEGQQALLQSLAIVLGETLLGRPRDARIALLSHRITFPTLGAVDVQRIDDGALLATSRDPQERPYPLSDDIRAAARAGRPLVGQVRIADDLEPEVPLAQPVLVDGRPRAVALTRVRFSQLWKEIATIRVGDRGFVRVVAEDGTVLAHGDSTEREALLRKAARGERSGPPAKSLLGARRQRAQSGEEMLAIGTPVPGLGWVMVLEQPTSEALASVRTLALSLLGLVLVVGLLAGGAAFVVARRVTRPLSALAARAGQIPSELEARHTPAPILLAGPAEVRALAAALNRMGTDLGQLYEQARENARMITLSHLGAGLAHDLRTPIVAIEAMAHHLAAQEADAADRAAFARGVTHQLARAHGIIADLELVAQERDPSGQETRGAVELRGLAAEVIARPRPHTSEDIRIQLDAPEPAIVRGHPLHFARLLENVISNALAAMSGRPGVVAVLLRREQGRVELVVRDQGAGIAPERLSTLFRPFGSTRRSGLGLGMPLIKGITERHGGTIRIESRVGEGTTLALSFPDAIASTDEATEAQPSQMRGCDP